MIFLFLILVALAIAKDANTDARIEVTFNSLMNDFEKDLASTAMRSAQIDFHNQYKVNTGQVKSVQQIYAQYKSESDALLAQFKPIARQIIENAAYNTNFKYYIYDEKLKAWHIYGRQPPNPPVDGSKENTKMLGAELKVAWKRLVGPDASTNLVQTIKVSHDQVSI